MTVYTRASVGFDVGRTPRRSTGSSLSQPRWRANCQMRQLSERAFGDSISSVPDSGLHYVAEPGVPSTVSALLEARAEATPDAPFVSFEETTLSYGEIVARAETTAGGLAAMGAGEGTKVAVLLPNSIEILETWFACSLMGAVLVP